MHTKKLFAFLIALPLSMSIHAPVSASEAEQKASLSSLLNEFLYGASIGDPAAHERFWADDLVYTSSAGARTDKATIVANTKGAQINASQPDIVFSATDVDIRLYDDIAVVAFKLIATPSLGSSAEPGEYFNTGTFQLRSGRWQAIAWQATMIPAPQ